MEPINSGSCDGMGMLFSRLATLLGNFSQKRFGDFSPSIVEQDAAFRAEWWRVFSTYVATTHPTNWSVDHEDPDTGRFGIYLWGGGFPCLVTVREDGTVTAHS